MRTAPRSQEKAGSPISPVSHEESPDLTKHSSAVLCSTQAEVKAAGIAGTASIAHPIRTGQPYFKEVSLPFMPTLGFRLQNWIPIGM